MKAMKFKVKIKIVKGRDVTNEFPYGPIPLRSKVNEITNDRVFFLPSFFFFVRVYEGFTTEIISTHTHELIKNNMVFFPPHRLELIKRDIFDKEESSSSRVTPETQGRAS